MIHRARGSGVRPDRTTLIVLGAVLAAALVVLGLVQLAAEILDVPVENLTYDLLILAEVPVHTGVLSQANLILWGVVAALSALVAWLLPARRLELALLAGLTAVMCIDDTLRLHEGVGPRFGVPEEAFYVVYAVVVLALARYLTPQRAGGAGWAYYAGAAGLALSVVTDVLFDPRLVLLEDGAKFVGTLLWVCVPVLTARELRHQPPAADPEREPLAAGRSRGPDR
jgi:hypothetical protein